MWYCHGTKVASTHTLACGTRNIEVPTSTNAPEQVHGVTAIFIFSRSPGDTTTCHPLAPKSESIVVCVVIVELSGCGGDCGAKWVWPLY